MTNQATIPTADEIHAILLSEAARVNLPEAYQRDLTFHDLNDLHESQTKHFIYVLRTSGTHIIRLDQGRQQYSVVSAIATFGDAAMHWYQFHAGRLEEITVDQAKRLASLAPSNLPY
jgi:hypothetical protein